jgi:uroporphyrinogen-III synthase
MRVLLTREINDARHTALKLKAHGLIPVLAPRVVVESVTPPADDMVYDYLIITSKHASRFAHGYKYKELLKVGDGVFNTAAEIAKYLADKKGKALYLRGEEISLDFKDILRQLSFSEYIVYKMVYIDEVIDINSFDAVLLYSNLSAAHTLKCLSGEISGKLVVCISHKLAEMVPNCLVAPQANEESMLKTLISQC